MTDHVRIAIVGTGFSGLGMAIRLVQQGIRDFTVLERAGDVGGTWRDNTYPGCACDVPSHLYSFSFAPNPDWSRTFSPQPEIWAYLRRCARDFGVLDHVQFHTELLEATWDDAAQRWRLETSKGPLTADVVVSGVGALCEPKLPDIPGIDRFDGTMFHSARWDHDHDLAGERVAVIGTGASAIQFVPRIQPVVGRLHVFQRTPPWIVPRTDRPITEPEHRLFRRLPIAQKAMRAGIYWGRELLVLSMRHPRQMRWFLRRIALKHLERSVPDPDLRAKLTPDYEVGCKRILISNDYLPSLTKENVELVTDGIAEIRERSIVTRDGTEREVDTIIFGTGFHVTDLPIAERIRCRDGRTLEEVWDGSPKAYNGTSVAGAPNLFFLLGPNTGLGHTSVVFMIEAQIEYVLRALRHLERMGGATIEPRPEAQQAFVDEIERMGRGTVWTSGGCRSWYLDRTGRNSTLWPTYTYPFRRRLKAFRPEDHLVGAPRPQRELAPA